MFSISFPSRSPSGTQELFLRVSDALSFRGPVANGQERKGPDVPAPEVFAFEPLASFGGVEGSICTTPDLQAGLRYYWRLHGQSLRRAASIILQRNA